MHAKQMCITCIWCLSLHVTKVQFPLHPHHITALSTPKSTTAVKLTPLPPTHELWLCLYMRVCNQPAYPLAIWPLESYPNLPHDVPTATLLTKCQHTSQTYFQHYQPALQITVLFPTFPLVPMQPNHYHPDTCTICLPCDLPVIAIANNEHSIFSTLLTHRFLFQTFTPHSTTAQTPICSAAAHKFTTFAPNLPQYTLKQMCSASQ